MSLIDSIQFLVEPQAAIKTLGLAGVIAIVFLETGAFFGFFLPGDSLLFTAGFFASKGHLSFAALFVGASVAAVLGDSVGYGFGKKIGPALFAREDSRFFNKKHAQRAHDFYAKYGKKTIILARFMPVIRTFAPIVAGVAGMEYRAFLAFNIIGGLAWTASMLALGFTLGSVVHEPDRFVLPAIAVIVIVSAAPALRQILKRRA